MVKLDSGDVFKTIRNAQDAGILEMLPTLRGEQEPGERFFESLQKNILEKVDLEKLDEALDHLAPTFRFMAEPAHWEPKEFTSTQMFWAVKNLQTMGVFDVPKTRLKVPGAGDRLFEYYQDILVNRIGAENLDRVLYTLGQCIGFLASEEALENTKRGMEE